MYCSSFKSKRQLATRLGGFQMRKTKPFTISKTIIWESYQAVKENKGSPGIDDVSIEMFEEDLKGNLYKLWNRMSSGSYFPQPVKQVEIPKKGGGKRPLGIPTVSDRIAQVAVKKLIEPKLDPYFHEDSYGYRPGKSALEAVGRCRQRCWKYDWVVDMDIKGFFDNVRHDLLLLALKRHIQESWILLYIERWLKSPVKTPLGELISREKGTPQGAVISPLLANLYLHYCLDEWLRLNYPKVVYERYADDQVCHCNTRAEAEDLKTAIGTRLQECGLELHPDKTRIVYCKDDDRRSDHDHTKFDFLGYTFRSRRSKSRYGKYFVNFTPAVSQQSMKSIKEEMRSWKLHLRSDKSLEDLGRMFDSKIRGWINYYGRFYKSGLYKVFRHLNSILTRWAMRKYKKLRHHRRRARHWLGRISRKESYLFYHWKWGIKPGVEQ